MNSVAIGMPSGPDVPIETALALAATATVCAKNGIALDIINIAGSSLVHTARNATLTNFLDKTTAERLFWIDSDIVWKPKDFLRLLAFSKDKHIVSGAYPFKRADRKVMINIPGEEYEVDPETGLIKIESLGIGFTVMQRGALEKWAAGKPRERDPNNPAIPIIGAFSVGAVGEDIRCFRELRDLGFQAWLDPTVELGHVGRHVYQRDIVEALGLSGHYR